MKLIPAEVIIKVLVFWDVALCRLVESCERFGAEGEDILSKRWYVSTKAHGVTFLKIVILTELCFMLY